jgi:hypothetical protein
MPFDNKLPGILKAPGARQEAVPACKCHDINI